MNNGKIAVQKREFTMEEERVAVCNFESPVTIIVVSKNSLNPVEFQVYVHESVTSFNILENGEFLGAISEQNRKPISLIGTAEVLSRKLDSFPNNAIIVGEYAVTKSFYVMINSIKEKNYNVL